MTNYAIVIGINDYNPPENRGLASLNGAIADAESVYDWIIRKGDVDSKNCHLITSDRDPLNPIKNDVDEVIGKIVADIMDNQSRKAGRLYFYFAGHGIGVEQDLEQNALCMANWSDFTADSSSISSGSYKQKFLSEGLFTEIVIWLDCCRNIKSYLRPGASPGIIPRLGAINNPKWFLAFATHYQNQAFETTGTNGEPRGIFTKVLLEGLNGTASPGTSTITGLDLSDHLYFNVGPEAQKAGFLQEPEVSTNALGKQNQIVFNVG